MSTRWKISAGGRWGALAALVLAVQASGASAASNGTALVVGDAQYAGQSVLAACNQAAHAVSGRLRQEGFSVTETIDGSAVALRDALGDFAARASASSGPALIYVCAEATAVDRRLFVLPSDVDLQRPLRPETQGVVLRALLNAMTGTKGTMIAELALRPGADAAPVMAALQDGVPDGLHLALTIGDGTQIGTLGSRLSANVAALGQSWDRFAAALQAAPQATPTAIALFQPPPVTTAPASPPRPEPAVVAVSPAPTAPEPKPAEPAPTIVAAAPPPAAAPAPEPAPAAADPQEPPPAAAPQPAAPPATRHAADPKPLHPRPEAEERTRRLQAALTRHKFYSGPLDGVTDARTIQAILSYQISIGDPATGSLTQTEIVRLLND